MKFDQFVPCDSCPYRKDVPPGTWHRSEFENLLEHDANKMNGSVFGCHQYRKLPPEEHRLCIGWVLDQLKRGVPSIRLRMLTISHPEAGETLNKAHSGGCELYDSIAEMAAINIPLTRRQKPPVARKKRKTR